MEKEFEYEYNPIKELKNGDESSKVIWSTKSINMAIDGLQKGMQLKSNPFIGKNTKLLKPDLVYRRTKEEIDDYIRCKTDPIYFASKCFLMTPEGLKPCVLRDYQEEYLSHLQHNRFSIMLAARQSGKCVTFDTEVYLKVNISSPYYQHFNTCIQYEKCNYLTYLIIKVPIFELLALHLDTPLDALRYSIYKKLWSSTCSSFGTFLMKKLLNILDALTYHQVKDHLVDNVKTIKEYNVDGLQILTDSGYQDIPFFYMTIPFSQYTITLENDYTLTCADNHRVFDEYGNEVYVKDLQRCDMVMTDEGPKRIVDITYSPQKVCMWDITVNDTNHRYYTNGILSHNSTTTAIYCLWTILFNTDKSGLILSKSGPAGIDLLKKIKDMYLYLPYHLKIGTLKWNQSSISFDNNSTISTEAFSPTAGLGKTINFLILDEFAWCPQNDVDLFYSNIIPTITTITDSNVCIMSTQNGFNLFYKLWKGAIEKRNIYAPFKVDWDQVPQFNMKTKQWEKRTEEWKQTMIGVLGSEESFYYQYGTQFSASNKCLVSRETLTRLNKETKLFEQHSQLQIFLQKPEYLVFDPNFDITLLKTGIFIFLIDLAEGEGGDDIVFNLIQVIGESQFKQVGYWKTNQLQLDAAALEFWILFIQLYTLNENFYVSIEWNTYGSLFYKAIKNLNEDDYDRPTLWRFNIIPNVEFEISNIIFYKKRSDDEESKKSSISDFRPGIKMTSATKRKACMLLKNMIESGKITNFDLVTLGQLENFEDLRGNGSFAAAYGHDDLIMTFLQIPLLMETPKFKSIVEDMNAIEIEKRIDSKWSTPQLKGISIPPIPNQIIQMN